MAIGAESIVATGPRAFPDAPLLVGSEERLVSPRRVLLSEILNGDVGPGRKPLDAPSRTLLS